MVNEGAFWLFVTETKQDGALLKLLVSRRIGGIKRLASDSTTVGGTISRED